ncbi:hypothetical protein LCGC14_2543500, partial [marine sediment metagenome]
MRGLLDLRKFCSIMELWIGNLAPCAHQLTPIELVGLRNLKMVANPPQTISSVGVSHLSVGWHRQRQEEVRSGLIPLVSP